MRLLAALTLLLAGVAAPTQAASSGPDRLHVTAKQDPASPSSAVVTVTGTVGRSGDADANSAPTDVYAGVVTVMALLPDRRCQRDPPGYFQYGDAITVTERRFSGELAINDAYLAGRKLRLCGYLTAQRRTTSLLRTITVARDSTTVTVAVPDNESGGDEVELILGGIMAWIFVIGLVAALMRLGSWLLDDTPSAHSTTLAATSLRRRRNSPLAHPAGPSPAPATAVPTAPPPPTPRSAGMPAAAFHVQAERPRRRAKPREVIQDAVDAIADTYRERLQIILVQRDGPDWLHALNHRRHVSMTLDGKRAPRPYEFLEPRAVLNCLAYDPAGLQLIPAAATTKARQLSGLVNEAHHPRPHAPLTEADGYRAWQLYTDITGHVPAGDPFDR
jgi:hypothetical protein